MSEQYNSFRWLMTSVEAPMIRSSFDPLPLEPGEVLVEVAGCGVCHTDLGYYFDGVRTNHPLPLALGHEVSGRVVSTSPGEENRLNHAVIVPAVIPCGKCDLCQRGHGRICREQKMPGNDIQGGFASHLAVPAAGLCEVDESRLDSSGITLADLSVIADAVTTPYQAISNAGTGAGDLAIIVGVGGVGGYAAQIASALGASVVAIDVDQKKLDNIAGYGADLTLNTTQISGRELKKEILSFATGKGLRTTEWSIFECSGTAAGQKAAFGLLTHGATLCVVGFTMEKVELMLSRLMAFDARAIGNWGCKPELYPAVLDLVLDGRINLSPFIEQRPMDAINEVFRAVHSHEMTRRPILVPDQQGA